jgi:hypothetical protein
MADRSGAVLANRLAGCGSVLFVPNPGRQGDRFDHYLRRHIFRSAGCWRIHLRLAHDAMNLKQRLFDHHGR